MTEYKFKVETVKQNLNGEHDIMTIWAANDTEADLILSQMLHVRDSYHDITSAYQTWSYETV